MLTPLLLVRAKDQTPQKYCTPIRFASFVYDLFSFCAHKFPTKIETREPGEIIVKCITYA